MIDDCVFCGIVSGAAPASLVYEDADLLAFLDIRPVTTGHLLVVPKVHASGLADLDGPTGAGMWQLARRLASALRRSSLRCDGVNLFLADGVAAGQEVFHVHLHVIPRFPGDGFAIRADWRVRERDELDATAEIVRAGVLS
ncbi:MAG TPA: HIT family protein [Pseudonocardiaceae bacterium]|nr:HIT family protein [Pseudonocardiaceae bacterium]